MREPQTPEWLDAARRGEPAALHALYGEHHQAVYRLCFRLLGRAEDAEDAMQTTFARAFQALPHFRGESQVKTWIFRIAVNEANSTLRGRRETAPFTDDMAAPESASRDERIAVRMALERIHPKHRVVLVLRYWEGMECGEIAAVLGVATATAAMRLMRARAAFRKEYEAP